jgi:cytidine deaminase
MKQSYKDLGLVALRSRSFAHAPFSRFQVGAALLTASGRVYTGCNVENSSYGLSMCAERVALFKAVSEGEHDFVAMAVAADTDPLTPPCGACRQVMSDLAGDIDVILVNPARRYSLSTVRKLLPHAFGADFLRSRRRSR